MKLLRIFIYFFLVMLQVSCLSDKEEQGGKQIAFVAPENNSRMRLFDDGWRFSKTDGEAAVLPGFDDSSWRKLDLPHDWSIEDLPEGEGVVGPFSKESPGGMSTGYTIGGTGIYRKTFSISEEDVNKIFTIYFDGVYMESDVWINGQHLGFHPNGYTPFYYEMTDYLNIPGDNVLVVRARNIGENSRWYSGSGIYRHVWLRVTDQANIPVWGVKLTTSNANKELATIHSEIKVDNLSQTDIDVKLKNSVYFRDQFTGITKETEVSVSDKSQQTISSDITISSPRLWSLEFPNLYTLKTEIIQDERVIDVVETKFGIRTLEFSPVKGFLLNGESVILKGGCLHHDNGILGAATFDRAEQRRVELMKANGFNAIRTSHNPPSQQFLDACDRLGILVMDEAFDRWEHPKRPNDYHRFFKEWSKKDIQSMVLRDQNHPSIFAWSYGNEIYERADTSGIRIAKQLIAAIKEVDTSIPVTQAICGFWEFKDRQRPWSDSEPAFGLMDIHGYNYKWQEYENDHAQFPERVMVGTESFAMEMYENYQMAVNNPYVIGDFVWTGMDYLGEAGIGQASLDSVNMAYPWFNGYCGDIDLIGFKKPQSYYRDLVWGRSQLEIAVEAPAPEGHKWVISAWGWRNELPSWNWSGQEGKSLDVYVYSQAEKVELKLNENLIDTQLSTDTSKYVFHFKVPYEKGKLKALAYSGEKLIAEKSIETTGKASQIKLIPERQTVTSNKNDLAYIQVQLVDEDGLLVMNDDQIVHFTVVGDAQIQAVGNGNPKDMKSFQSGSCMTYLGRCMAIIRPEGREGKLTVTAKSKSLESDGIDVMMK
ncbi:glycoside hydrolase family 2 TIM barrel-domain containing protein [uncultured Sunxiuqinia sp.]|uniref:glycoside hydrolase family 2 TIM barrel-domain containing protein n=1 Tax=uncultured Sunxiuqinia sp. TaxID=1573825 RepID=UPI002AA8ED27|nr:glycoside hydrolase family 2 TIM barrel-domain containing protein [uncultured Sunxiuqinia sp.]